ncbi:MAG: hypothetical protein ACI9HE_003561 [Planctomycetota bacterium]|jgi:hypothetical protein
MASPRLPAGSRFCSPWSPLFPAQLDLWVGAAHRASTGYKRRRSQLSPVDGSPTPSSISGGLPRPPSEWSSPVPQTLAYRQIRMPFALEGRRPLPSRRSLVVDGQRVVGRITRDAGQLALVFLMTLMPVLASSPELSIRTCARTIPARSTPRCSLRQPRFPRPPRLAATH